MDFDHATFQPVQTVDSTTGTDRLICKYREISSFSRPDEVGGYNFHSLVWQRLQNGVWVDHLAISQADFQLGCLHQRWISSIHSFDTTTGTAILKIAEGDAPENSVPVTFIYSWREWDLTTNTEVKNIRICSNPFEPLEK